MIDLIFPIIDLVELITMEWLSQFHLLDIGLYPFIILGMEALEYLIPYSHDNHWKMPHLVHHQYSCHHL